MFLWVSHNYCQFIIQHKAWKLNLGYRGGGFSRGCRGVEKGGRASAKYKHPRNNKAPAFLQGLCFVWCGTRRTVCFSETRLFGRLEFAGKFGVPQLVTINRLASYGVRWNRTRAFVPVVSTPRDPGLPW